jgi:hypothetical protein
MPPDEGFAEIGLQLYDSTKLTLMKGKPSGTCTTQFTEHSEVK